MFKSDVLCILQFQKNNSNNENSVGANCNKVIILLTDGGTDNAEDVFKEHNWPNKSVRINDVLIVVNLIRIIVMVFILVGFMELY